MSTSFNITFILKYGSIKYKQIKSKLLTHVVVVYLFFAQCYEENIYIYTFYKVCRGLISLTEKEV